MVRLTLRSMKPMQFRIVPFLRSACRTGALSAPVSVLASSNNKEKLLAPFVLAHKARDQVSQTLWRSQTVKLERQAFERQS